MSRMFRVVSGGHEPSPDLPAAADAFAAGLVPFVEIGGPDGLISSAVKSPPPLRTAPLPAVATEIVAPTALLAPPAAAKQPPHPAKGTAPMVTTPSADTRLLSVTFHRIPKVGLRLMHTGVVPEIVTYHYPDHPISAEYRQVRDEIIKQFDEPGPRVTLFTASAPAAGTTTVLVNFATSLAQEFGSRVLLVDANFARPGIARRLGGTETPGLAEVLNQSIPLAWALQPSPVTNLHVLACGTAIDHTEEQMANDFPRLLSQLRQWFDWVVVDLGVWGDIPAADQTCGKADGVYLVSRDDDTDRPEFASLRVDIAASGGHVRGYISTRQ